jgi:hypothetical protein
MSLATDILARLVVTVTSCRLVSDPFEHLELEAPFSDAVYRRLVGALPPTSEYVESPQPDALLPDGGNARGQFDLRPDPHFAARVGRRACRSA